MTFLVLMSALFAFVLALTAFSRPRALYGAMERRLERLREADRVLADELTGNLFERFIRPGLQRMKRSLERAASKGNSARVHDAKLERQLRMAGYYISLNAFGAIRAAVAVGVTLLALLALSGAKVQSLMRILLIVSAAIIGYLGPIYFLRFRIKSRQQSIRHQLPDMMDVLSVSIDAGLSFDMALKRALDKFSGALQEEMTITAMEIQMGKPRRVALTELGERNDINELKLLASAVVQSEQMGTPIKQVLKTQSAQLRADRKRAAQEKGMKASVKMLLPMVAFIFPVILIILMGPTVLNLMKTFK